MEVTAGPGDTLLANGDAGPEAGDPLRVTEGAECARPLLQS